MTTPQPTPATPTKPTAGYGLLVAVFACPALLLFGWIYNLVTGDGSGSGPSSTLATAACRVLVEDRLVAPSTADFSNLSASEGSGDRWTVTGSVDAENRLGTPIRMDFTCVVEYDGGDWRLVRMSGLTG
jgi:hypothetical protein